MSDPSQEPAGKAYEAEGITVYYDPPTCIHSGNCVRGLPEVFDAKRRPWITPEAASPEAVAAAIRRCPSGALQFRMRDGSDPAE